MEFNRTVIVLRLVDNTEGEDLLRENSLERCVSPSLLGYETREGRAKFTVYKILVVRGPRDSWVIFRRYREFCQLRQKLRADHPDLRLSLPPKRWLKDNYNKEFLEERQKGLQIFLHSLMTYKEIINSEAVKHFLRWVDRPHLFTLEESRVFCKTLEETYQRLQRELFEKQTELDTLRKILEEKEMHIDILLNRVK
ncbi:sorting nexin-16-like [Synchiropus splendidus]|uniref:sorting nexin-16-like n=1 Tax=Synchiropus splendidus TaxID=270530 RepID=UPI00237E1724|nr:sorting nexin-16-like [Synchiropus splendidus]